MNLPRGKLRGRFGGKTKMTKRKIGQSILEYVIVLAAIIAAVIIGATNAIKPAVTTTMNNAATLITTSANKLVLE